MKVQLNTKEVSVAVKGIADIFEKSAMLPFSGLDVLMTVPEEGLISFEAANHGLYTKWLVSGEADEAGDVLINGLYARKLKLSGKQTNMETDDNRLKLKSGRLKFELNTGSDASKVKAQRPSDMETTVHVDAKLLQKGFKCVNFKPHAAEDVLNIRIMIRDKKLIMIANDPFRAALFTETIDSEGELDAFVPAPFLKSALSKLKGKVALGADHSFRIVTEAVDIYHPIAQADPYDVEGVVNELRSSEPDSKIKFEVGPTKESVMASASIMADDDDNDGKIQFAFENQTALCRITAKAGDSECELEADWENDVIAHLGARHTIEFFDLLPQGSVTMYVWDESVMLETDGVVYVQPQIEV